MSSSNANHHPAVAEFIRQKQILIVAAMNEERWLNALDIIQDAGVELSKWSNDCLHCQVLKAPLMRQKSQVFFKLENYEAAAYWNDCYAQYMKDFAKHELYTYTPATEE